MRDHDVEREGPAGTPSQRDDARETPSGRDVGHCIGAGRADALGPSALLHLQRAAGNRGVSSLIAQRAAGAGAGAGHDPDAAADADQARDAGRSPVDDVVATRGSPLEPEVRSSMEASLGHDFGDVQVHSDAPAAASARSVQAQAYTVGNHVVFGEGGYQPGTADGRRTLAHELTHVVQQRQGPVDGTPAPGGIRVSDPGDRFEREAESVAERVMAPAPGPPPVAGVVPAVQRQDDGQAADDVPVQRQADEEAEEAPAEPQPEQAPAAEAGTEPAPPPEGAPEVAGDEDEPVTGA